MNPNNLLEAFFEGYKEQLRVLVREEITELKTELKNYVPKEEKYRNKQDSCKFLEMGRTAGSRYLDKMEAEGKLHPIGEGRSKKFLESELLALGKK